MSGNTGESRQELKDALTAVQVSFDVGPPVASAPEAPKPPAEAKTGDKQDLVSAFDRLVEYGAGKPRAILPPASVTWKRFAPHAVIAGCLASMAYLLVAKPAWLYPPFEVAVPAPTGGNATQLMTAASIMIDQHLARKGKLPATLDELGLPLPGMALFDTGDGSYRISATAGSTDYLMTSVPGRPLDLRKETR